MTVADLFPARTQPDGRVYRRAVDHDGKLGDGWTYDPALAHPDYFAPGAPAPLPPQNAAQIDAQRTNGTTPVPPAPQPQEDTSMDITADFTPEPRATEFEGYPLPPPTPRPASVFGQWGWYKLPHPETGRPTGFPRATTIAKVLDDREGLAKWGRRETAARVRALGAMSPTDKLNPRFDTTAASALAALDVAIQSDKATAPDAVLDLIDNMLGGAAARELGECVHAWLEALDMGIVLLRDVPALVRPHVDNYYRVMSARGLVAVPEYVERTVLNTQCEEAHGLTVAGKIDRVFRIVDTGELVLGDVKTSKDLQYSWLSFAVQVGGVYGWAERILTLDGTGWEPMPAIRDDYAILMHVPSNNPAGTSAITIDKWFGGEALAESAMVKDRRKRAPKAVPAHAMPAPSDAAIRYATARAALSAITSLDDGQAIYETYQDVWDDDLGQHAALVAGLLD